MKSETYFQLSPEDKQAFKDKAKDSVDEELAPLVEQGVVKKISDSKPRKNTRSFLKKSHEKLKERFQEQQINYTFSGDMKKLEELVLRKRKNLNKPLSVIINGCEIFFTLTPFIYLTNEDGTEANAKLEKLIEEEKKRSI